MKKRTTVTKISDRQTPRARKLRIDDLITIEPITINQRIIKRLYREVNNLLIHGYPGTGKTFLALYYALEEVLDPQNKLNKIIIVRSVVPTRDIGFLKGTDKEKTAVYETPYRDICEELFGIPEAYDLLVQQGVIQFETTSFIRGRSIPNAIIIVDECENLNFHELDSTITRAGKNSKIMYCGDYRQSDLTKSTDKNGLINFMTIIKRMKNFKSVEMGMDDIVRSELVKEYIILKTELGF